MFDVFYYGPKPGLFEFERPAENLEHAASMCRTGYYWYIYGGNDYTEFDFGYQPVPWESHYTHVWPDQHQPNGNVYLTRNPTADIHYHTDMRVHRLGDPASWHIPANIDHNIDWRWSPDPLAPPYIYHFPSQHQSACGLTYTVPGATDVKLCDAFVATALPDASYWEIPDHIDPASIDQTWHPNVLDPAINYHFPVQWNWDNIGGPVYRMPGATGDKYINDFIARTRANMKNWVVPDNVKVDSFDFSWVPHPKDPAYIYKFPTVWNAEGGPEYHVPGATEEKYITELVAETLPDMSKWSIPEEINVDQVDFSWVPHPRDPAYIYHFGTDYQQSVGLTYTVPGATELKFAGPVPVRGEKQRVLEVLDIFFVDKNNATAQTRYERLKARYHNIQKIRYANSIMDTIKRCVNRTRTNKFWIISSEYDYDNFDFAWHAEPWQSYMTHVFPSQHQKWSDTFLINRWEFERNSQWANGLEQFPNLNFVNNQTVFKPDNLHDIYYVDHGNGTIARHQYEYLRLNHPDMIITRFVGNYLDTFKRIMTTAETEYVWIINSICNYSAFGDYGAFDFTWQPEPWQREMIHVFQSDHTKQGDTFYIHVESFKKQMYELDILDFFNVINYIPEPRVPRFDCPVHLYEGDDLVTEIQNYKFESPYVFFTKDSDRYDNLARSIVPDFCLWSEKDRTAVRYNGSGSSVLVPRDIKTHLKTQIYDYPYINKLFSGNTDRELDIVYISNGEPDEQRWFEHTEYMSNRTVKWSRGVNGRTAAYQAAARLSDTPWFFMVFAKLEVLGNNFDWDWQPDYFQGPKHYIFNARNPVNGLEYGHMGMIAYNKNLVLANNTPGIDFTLSQPHESVPMLSGIAHFNQDPWMTWRTAFREVLKLRLFMDTAPTLETEHRLNTWLDVAQGEYAEWCLRGARDAVKYYAEVNGDLEKLKLSFDWAWLRERFNEQ
jgi:hypothetical protein